MSDIDSRQSADEPTRPAGPAARLGRRLAALEHAVQSAPRDPAARRELARALAQLGRADEALLHCRQAIKLDSTDATGLYEMAVLLHTGNYYRDAIDHYRRALAGGPDRPGWWLNFGRACLAAGHHAEAVEAFRRAQAATGAQLRREAQLGLARALLAADDASGALAAIEGCLRLGADAAALACQAEILERLSRPEAALARARQALAASPQRADMHALAGRLLAGRGETEPATVHLLEALRLVPDHPAAATALADLAAAGGRREQAEHWRSRAAAGVQLGHIVEAQRALESAILHYEWAIADKQDYARSPDHNMVAAGHEQSELEQALADYEGLARQRDDYAVRFAGRYAVTHYNLANALLEQGHHAAAIGHYERAVELDPDHADAQSNLLLALNYAVDVDEEELAARHRRYGERLAGLERPLPARATTGRPRIGYLSADFRRHSVAYFIEPVLREHDRTTHVIYCYSNCRGADATTERLRQLADRWRDVSTLDDAGLIECIRRDGIDVLIELNGHTGGNRLPALARRAAPLQMTWLGYPNTTGLATMDYHLTDALADPPGETDAWHTERLLRLPGPFSCYGPPAEAPPVGPLPALAANTITFGSFNLFAKMNDALLRCWARLLQRVPHSRLLLKNNLLGEPAIRHRVGQLFEAEGIDRGRLELLGHVPSMSAHLGLYNRIDIALDTFPYNGTTTSCEALWMGCPVVTYAGRVHRSRVGLSLLSQLGLESLVAQSSDDYVALAERLASDPRELARLRGQLRGQMAASPLCDARAFTRNLERVLSDLLESASAPARDR